MITFLTIILVLGIIYTIIQSLKLIPGIKDFSKLPSNFQDALTKMDLSEKAKRISLSITLALVVLCKIVINILLIIAIQ